MSLPISNDQKVIKQGTCIPVHMLYQMYACTMYTEHPCCTSMMSFVLFKMIKIKCMNTKYLMCKQASSFYFEPTSLTVLSYRNEIMNIKRISIQLLFKRHKCRKFKNMIIESLTETTVTMHGNEVLKK